MLKHNISHTLIVAWFSISCHALSNFHSCFWLRNRCSARAIVSFAALCIPTSAKHKLSLPRLTITCGIVCQTDQMLFETGLLLPGNVLELFYTHHRHHNKVWIFQWNSLVSWPRLSVAELICSVVYEILH